MTVFSDTAVQGPARTLPERLMRMAGRTPVHIGLVIIALVWLVPTIGLLVTSFRPRADIQSSGWWTIFAGNLDLTIDNYTTVLGADLASQSMFEAFLNTLYITVPATILPLILASLAAYAFAWVKFPFRDTLFLAIIALLLVPLQMTLIPLSRLFRDLGLIGTFWPIWIIHTTFALPFGIFLLRNFFITLPKDLIEAARIDGAGELTILTRIAIPLCKPALLTAVLLTFIGPWNEFLWPFLVTKEQSMQPLAVSLANYMSTVSGRAANPFGAILAGACVLAAPAIVLFVIFQRRFVASQIGSAVKG